jgi:hypothetical protein
MWKRKRTLWQIEEQGFDVMSDRHLVNVLRHTIFGHLPSKLLLFVIGSRNKQVAETELWCAYRRLFYLGAQVHTVVVI